MYSNLSVLQIGTLVQHTFDLYHIEGPQPLGHALISHRATRS